MRDVDTGATLFFRIQPKLDIHGHVLSVSPHLSHENGSERYKHIYIYTYIYGTGSFHQFPGAQLVMKTFGSGQFLHINSQEPWFCMETG